MEYTFVMLKPDAAQRGLMGEIISRLEKKNMKIVKMEMVQLSGEEICNHYYEHLNKSYFEDLCKFMSSGSVVRMVVSGDNAVRCCRLLAGATSPLEASAGTVRGDFCSESGKNLIHTSDSVDSANREIAIHFPTLIF